MKNRPLYVGRTFFLLKKNFGGFLRFEILYKLISIFIFFPLMEKFETLSLRLSGVYYISNYNLAKVLKNPLVWAMVLISLILIGIYISIEILGLASGIHAAHSGQKISAYDMFGEAFEHLLRLFTSKKPTNLLFIPYIFLMVPLVDPYDAFSIINSFSFFGYLFNRITRKTRYLVTVIIAIAIILLLMIVLIYTAVIMVSEKEDFLPAAKKSIKLVRFRIPGAILRVFSWILLSALVLAITFLLSILIIRFGIMWLDPDINPNVAMRTETLYIIEIIIGLLFILVLSPVVIGRLFLGYLYRSRQNDLTVPEYTETRHFIRNHWLPKSMIWLITIVCGFFFIPPKYQQAKLALADNARSIMIMAHRGDSATAPENTLPAFRNAIEHGADAIELDVQMTKDGTIVCMHDSSLKRTTGVNKKIWQVTYEEIKDLDNGSFFNHSYRFTRIPTLDQALKLVKDKAFVNIEIKRTGHDTGIVEKTLEIVAANHFEDDCDITSQDYNTLKDVKKINPDIYTVYTTAVGGGDISKLKAANAFSIEENFVTAGLVSYMRKENKGIYVWTVNSEAEINRMIDLGVDAIITNNVSMAVNLLQTNSGVIGIIHKVQRLLLS
ncbi:MAG: glycerophosphoryl diester phosphodiesterase membrane domain-containing protein [Lachnospiraceae bacterium]|nr:glycerophosphoryl diester phosphodiesterase membrane domain-containing protein [Lachnospiraceae bacterium]